MLFEFYDYNIVLITKQSNIGFLVEVINIRTNSTSRVQTFETSNIRLFEAKAM